MTLSEFVLTDKTGSSALDWVFHAEVSVTTGMLWWKKTVRRKIRRKFCDPWFFVDTGNYTPGFQAEALARAYEAQHG